MDDPDNQLRHFREMVELAEALRTLPADILSHEYAYEAFGSWFVVVRCNGVRMRLVFDGRDCIYRLERSASRKSPDEWQEAMWHRPSRSDASLPLREILDALVQHRVGFGTLTPDLPEPSALMNPFPEQLEFLEFFGAEPRLTDPGIPWAYNCLVFESRASLDVVRLEIEPASHVLRIVWSQAAVERLRLELNRVTGLVLEREEGQDTLVARLSHPHADELRLRLRPTVHLQWGDRS